jgi:hypothetical protein
LAGYVIHTPSGLSRAQEALAAEWGPPAVAAEASPPDLARAAGFVVSREVDVTEDFLETCERIIDARLSHEAALRDRYGDDAFEEEQIKKLDIRKAIRSGLLRRMLLVASKR